MQLGQSGFVINFEQLHNNNVFLRRYIDPMLLFENADYSNVAPSGVFIRWTNTDW